MFLKTNHFEGKTSLQIRDSLTKVSSHFPLCATGVLELHEILNFVTFEYSSLSAVPDTTNYPSTELTQITRLLVVLRYLRMTKMGKTQKHPR